MRRDWSGKLALTLILGGATLAALFVFNRLAAPHEKILAGEGAGDPDYRAVLREITEETVGADLEALLQPPSRYPGTAGCEAAADHVVQELRRLGYQVVEQPFDLTVPVTRSCSLTDADGDPLPGLSLGPMLPNFFRTCTTPPEGLTGTVYRGEKGLAQEFESVDLKGNFVLLPIGQSWSTVAGMGAAAILYYDDGKKVTGAEWDHHKDASLNVPRFLVRGDTAQLDGRRVRLTARVDYERCQLRNILAFLDRPAGPAAGADGDEALIVGAFYDSFSYVPDLSPGAEQAGGVTALLAAARRLASEREALRRPVFLLATAGHSQGLAGMREFVRAVGARNERQAALDRCGRERGDLEAGLTRLKEALTVAEDARYWQTRGEAAEADYWRALPAERFEDFRRRLVATLDEDLMAAVEALALARVDWVREDMPVTGPDGGPAASFTAYNTARERQARMQALISVPAGRAKEQWGEEFAALRIPQRTAETIRRRLADGQRALRQAVARERVARLLIPYSRLLYLGLDLTAGSGRLALVCGYDDRAAQTMPADAAVAAQVAAAAVGLDSVSDTPLYVKDEKRLPRFENLVRGKDCNGLGFFSSWHSMPFFFDSTGMLMGGHTAFTLTTAGAGRRWTGTPFDSLEWLLHPELGMPQDADAAADTTAGPAAVAQTPPITHLTLATRLAVASVSRLARGYGQVVPTSIAGELHTIRGQVVSRVGDNLTPDHAMGGAVVLFPRVAMLTYPRGMDPVMAVTADAEGHFALDNVWENIFYCRWSGVDLDAAQLRPENGEIEWTLSTADSGQNMPFTVRVVPLAQYDKSLAMPVLFRAKAVEVVPMPDPATFQNYAGFEFIESKGLAIPGKYKIETAGGTHVCFVPPDARLYFTFKKGLPKAPQLMRVRAFALGADGPADGSGLEGQPEITGRGYLAADCPRITNIELDAALSMAQVNARRLALQERYSMADEMLLSYGRKAVDLAEEARRLADDGRTVEAKHQAAASLAYSSNIHPEIRKNASDAVFGILFYLLLAIPFAIFVEKLFFASADLRRQLAIEGILFILYFLALKLVHPAYQLVRSSYMILLGFITFTLAAMVSAFVAARFSSNIAQLQQKLQRRAEVADVSRTGALMTAFVLGLGHMRKRKVRTGLTVGTLILTTFVMLSFTSISTNVTDVEFAVGTASYSGLLARSRTLADVTPSLNPLRELYGKEHRVVPRQWGATVVTRPGFVVERAVYAVSRPVGEKSFDTEANGILGLSCHEPELTDWKDAFDVLARWFETDNEYSCFLSRPMAEDLRLAADAVGRGDVRVKMGSAEYRVLGIFDPGKVADIVDLDGQSLLPLDILGTVGPGQQQNAGGDASDIPEDIVRLPAEVVVITPHESMPARTMTASVAVAFRGLDYAGARAAVVSHLERSAEPAYYGLDGTSYYGGKFRMRSLAGLVELILPIVIAALTVLNTMRGSVYERRDELYVFNAVGLSPAHIKALFVAEASVYAVVGAVGGYLVAQGVGTLVRLSGLSAGFSLNYSSMSSVVVSLIIMAVVFVSSLFPARMAAQLAAPAELMARRRRTAEGDVMEFDLPFTFNRRDRIGIIPYFVDWFDNYGEGSSGEFFCSPPVCSVVGENHGGAAPAVETTTWLKPYDLGVSQTVRLVVRHLPETGDNVATVTMVRKSGSRESWERCCHAFIGLLRKRFLTWRAVPDENRTELLERGRALLQPPGGLQEGQR